MKPPLHYWYEWAQHYFNEILVISEASNWRTRDLQRMWFGFSYCHTKRFAGLCKPYVLHIWCWAHFWMVDVTKKSNIVSSSTLSAVNSPSLPLSIIWNFGKGKTFTAHLRTKWYHLCIMCCIFVLFSNRYYHIQICYTLQHKGSFDYKFYQILTWWFFSSFLQNWSYSRHHIQ